MKSWWHTIEPGGLAMKHPCACGRGIAALVRTIIMVPLISCSLAANRPQIDLTGTWDFYADVGDAMLGGVTVKPGKILVPGAWQTQGFGPPGGVIPSSVIGSDLSPADYLRHNLNARCLYVRDVNVPAAWQGQRVFLCVRRVYRYADLTVNGTSIGGYEGFSSPFECDITRAVRFGRRNQLVLGVDNRARAGRDTVGTANYFGNWGGLGGVVYLEARPVVRIADVFAMPRVAESRAMLRITIANDGDASAGDLGLEAEVQLVASPGNSGVPPAARGTRQLAGADAGAPRSAEQIDLPVDIRNARLWTPDTPFLYAAHVKLRKGKRVLDEMSVRFGMREITAAGRQLFLNGKPLYLSGYGDDATEPITGMLPSDKELYRRRLSLMRHLGFNFVRHHSCVPHDEYLEAADEVGMLVQPEAGMAYVKFWPKAHGLFTQEWPHIVRAFRNHPSIWAWCIGNELFLNELPERKTDSSPAEFSRQDALAVVAEAYRQAKALDPTRLVHASDGGTPQEFSDVYSAGGAAKFGPKPMLLHEYGTYTCSLPDFALIPRLNGIIRPLTYERAERYVREHHLEAVYSRLRRSSLLMRADAQKYYIEAAKNKDGNNGFSFWLGIDFPDSPEGCWDEGILNQLWEPKPYVTNNLSDVTGPTVLLCDAGLEARSFYGDEPKKVGLRLWHYGAQSVADARLTWRVTEGGKVLQSGERTGIACGLGQRVSVGEVVIDAPAAAVPRFLALQVELWQGTKRVTKNAWEFYAYPRVPRPGALPGVYSEAGPLPGATALSTNAPLPPDIRLLITRDLKRTRHALLLREGKCAVLLLGAGGFKETRAGYFLNQSGSGFGGIIEDHPVFSSIPHEGRLHLGLYQLIAGGGMLDAELMPAALREGAVVWGLKLTAWISPVKDLNQAVLWSEAVTENQLRLVLCNLDLMSDKPESRYVLGRTIDYLLAAHPDTITKRCESSELDVLLR